MPDEQITLIVVALIGAVGGFLTYLTSRRSSNRQRDRDVVTSWRELAEGVQVENKRLNREIVELRGEIAELRGKLSAMQAQLFEQQTRHEQERRTWLARTMELESRMYRMEHGDETPPPAHKSGATP